MSQISIIVPVYKVEPYIHRCIDSIIAQTLKDFEVILVDDGSPDKCGEICDEYAKKDKRIQVIHQKNRGLSAARNTGLEWVLKNSCSEWISFVDSDDWIHPQFLALLLEAATRSNCPIGSCRFAKVESEQALPVLVQPTICSMSSFDIYTENGRAIFAYVWNKLYRKELWEGIRFPEGRNWEDIATSYKVVFQTETIGFVDAELYYYFFNPEGIANGLWVPKRVDQLWAYETVLKDPIVVKYPKLNRLLRKHYIYALLDHIKQIKESNLVSKKVKNQYTWKTRKKLQFELLRYGKKVGFTKKENQWYFEIAYPRLSWLLWTCKGVINRITHFRNTSS